jgi:hypothetical protein
MLADIHRYTNLEEKIAVQINSKLNYGIKGLATLSCSMCSSPA